MQEKGQSQFNRALPTSGSPGTLIRLDKNTQKYDLTLLLKLNNTLTINFWSVGALVV